MLQRYNATAEGHGRPLSRGKQRPKTAPLSRTTRPAPTTAAAGGKRVTHKKKTALGTSSSVPGYLRPRSASAVKDRPNTATTASPSSSSRPTVVIPTVRRSVSADRSTRKSRSQVQQNGASTTAATVQKSAGLGKSAGGTRVRSRSQEKRQQLQQQYGSEGGVRVVRPTPSRRSPAAAAAAGPVDTASLSYLVTLQGLTNTFLHASHSLEEAAQKLQRASQTFDESMQMNRSRLDLSTSASSPGGLHHHSAAAQSAEALSYLMESSMQLERPNTPPNQHRSQRLAGTTNSASPSSRKVQKSSEAPAAVSQDPRLSLDYSDVAALVRQKLHDKLSRMLIPSEEN